MQIDVLYDIKKAVEKAIEKGQSFESFKKELKPKVQEKGWWGKKEMKDPLTGEIVEAQLGSDRRLQTIYNVNLRSAYQKGQYERTMASDLHPYMMYCIGNSKKHREEHVSWNGLILPKDDPWWDTHLPPNGYGCNCYTRAITEYRKQKYEKDGIQIPRKSDGSGGYKIKPQTKAPPNDYQAYWNKRKGMSITERIPKGITPGFNWNQGKTSRSTLPLLECIKKAEDKALPEQIKQVVDAFLTNKASKDSYVAFVDKAKKEGWVIDQKYTSPVGFIDLTTAQFLESQGVKIGNRNLIILEAGLLQSRKMKRHEEMGNAPTITDWCNLMDYLFKSRIYYDGEKLIYLRQKSKNKYMKIVVDVGMYNKPLKGVSVSLPKVDTMYELALARKDSDMGRNEFIRITETLKRIR